MSEEKEKKEQNYVKLQDLSDFKEGII